MFEMNGENAEMELEGLEVERRDFFLGFPAVQIKDMASFWSDNHIYTSNRSLRAFSD
jgi:hypothetical protein